MTHAGDRVLLVEDDRDVREAVALYLQSEGYTVVEATNGREALEALRSGPDGFCLIVLDLFMPVMDGATFRREQLQDPRTAKIPVLVISADSGAVARARHLGAVGCLGKPLDFDRLAREVAAHC